MIYWKLDSFDTILPDTKGSDVNLTFTPTTEISASDLGLGRRFTTNIDLGTINFNTTNIVSNDNDFTIIMSINKSLTPFTTSGNNVAMSKNDDNSWIAFDAEGYIGNVIAGAFNRSSIYTKLQDVPGSNLVQVVCVITNNGNNANFYMNGVDVGTRTGIQYTPGDRMYVGNTPIGNSPCGLLDEIIILDYALSSADVTAYYSSYRGYIEYEDDLELKFFFSGDDTPEGSLGGPIQLTVIDPYSTLNIFLPEILRRENFQSIPIYRCLYFKNTSNITIYGPKLNILSDIVEARPKVALEAKNTSAPMIADKYDSTNTLASYNWIDPSDIDMLDQSDITLAPGEHIAIWFKRHIDNLMIPETIITSSVTTGNNKCNLTYTDSSIFTENEFVIVYHQIDDDNYIYEIKQIKTIETAGDVLNFTSSFSQDFPIGSSCAKLDRSLLYIEYGA